MPRFAHILMALCLPSVIVILFGIASVQGGTTLRPTTIDRIDHATGAWAMPEANTMTLEYRDYRGEDLIVRPYPQRIAQEVIVTPTAPAVQANDESTEAVINVGRWLDLLQELILAVLGIVMTFVSWKLPAIVRPWFLNGRVKALYTNAVYQMIAKARAAGDIAPDGTMKVDLGNKWIKEVVQYVDQNADATLKEWIGDKDSIIAKAKAFTEAILASTATEYKPAGSTTSNIKQPKA